MAKRLGPTVGLLKTISIGATLTGVTLGICLVLAGGVRADAADAAPAIKLSATSQPTNFQAGTPVQPAGISHLPTYAIIVTNIGSAPTTGPVEVQAHVPPGLTASEPTGRDRESAQYPCGVVSSTVSCEVPQGLRPSDRFTIELPVEVAPNAPESLTLQIGASGGGAPAVATAVSTAVTTSSAPFGFLGGSAGLNGVLTSTDGSASAASQAGAHPGQMLVEVGLNTAGVRNLAVEGNEIDSGLTGAGSLRDANVQLPPGMVVNPLATPVKCTEAELGREATGQLGCPEASQVGVVEVLTSLTSIVPSVSPLYNMVPPPGAAASLAFNALSIGIPIHLLGSVNSAGIYELTASASYLLARPRNPILGFQAELWGDPSSPIHEGGREGCLVFPKACPLPSQTTALVTTPTACSTNLPLTAQVDSWEAPGQFVSRTGRFEDLSGEAMRVEGCNRLRFEPTIQAQPTTNVAENASGLNVTVHQPQDQSLEGLSTAALKDATVTLPEGLTINAAAGNGLSACSESEIGYLANQSGIHFSEDPQTCPDSAKIGTVEVTTPLLEHKLGGAIYTAKPFENPFGSQLGIYLAIEDEESGIVSKLAGHVVADPRTGQLTTTFTENPQLPLEDITLHIFEGPGGILTTPMVCGEHTTTSTFTPWSTPEGVDVHPQSTFQTPNGCVGSEGAAPKAFSFSAGTERPLSGAYSPFVLHLARPDRSQHITGIETTLPEGLLGKLAGVSYCPESGIAQARSREEAEEGKLEQSSPSCPSSSEVGTVDVTAGAGIKPIPVSGHAYLAGPYKGAPLSMVVIVPAVAGPFDLGTVVNRIALNVGEYDARIRAVADPLPTIRDGIPFDVRSIDLRLGRPGFTLNPTSCEAMAVDGQIGTQAGQSVSVNNRFQVGECSRLAFKPSLKISLKGAVKRTGHPALKAVLTYPKKGEYANVARAQVALPHSEFLDQGNLNKVCKQADLKARTCPASTIYGHAKAWSPLLDKPVEGPVYLGVGFGYKLPALVAELNGQIRVLLVGKVDTGKNKGIRSTFEAVPDAPVERFVLEMKGGKKYGLLENSENICKKKQTANASFTAQNGRVRSLSPKIANSCKGKKKGKHGKKAKHGKKKRSGAGKRH
jgi:hypothetical protein